MLSSIRLSSLERLVARQATFSAASTAFATPFSTDYSDISATMSSSIRRSGLSTELNRLNTRLERLGSTSTILGSLRTNLSSIRTQVETIRSYAEADLEGGLTNDERAASQQAIDDAVTEINKLASVKTDGRRYLNASTRWEYQNTISGINPLQLSNVNVQSIEANTTRTLSGSVLSLAEKAELTLGGSAG